MKRILFFYIVAFFASMTLVFGQSAGVGASISPSSIPVGGTAVMTIEAGVVPGTGTYGPGDLILTISVPNTFYTATTAPTGGSYTWAFDGVNTWTGTLNATISGTETISLNLTGVAVTTAGAQASSINISPQFVLDEDGTGDNSAAPTALVTASIPTMSCTTNTLNPSSYIANGSSQTGTYNVGVSNLVAGASYNFTISGSNFSGTTTIVATAGETTVSVPVTYNGGGIVGTQPVTITGTITSSGAPLGTPNTCNTTATITAPINTCKAGTVAPSVF